MADAVTDDAGATVEDAAGVDVDGVEATGVAGDEPAPASSLGGNTAMPPASAGEADEADDPAGVLAPGVDAAGVAAAPASPGAAGTAPEEASPSPAA
ncbi:MAG: hypothetical protein R6W77_04295 [Trueperaceae bacterium]